MMVVNRTTSTNFSQNINIHTIQEDLNLLLDIVSGIVRSMPNNKCLVQPCVKVQSHDLN